MKKNFINKKWLPIMSLALIGIILMLVYELGYYVGARVSDEKIIVWFYFTFISNVMGLILALFKTLNIFKSESKHFQRFEIMTTTNLTVTFLVFWAVLAPHNKTWNVPLATIQNIFVHLLTPVALITMFVLNATKGKQRTELSSLKTSLINLIMPLVWIIVAIIIYFSLGADEHSAIYSFLDFKGHKVMAAIAIPGIALVYFGITFGLTYLQSRKIK